MAQLVKIAFDVIQDVYYSYCLCVLSPRFIRWLLQLGVSLAIAFGSHRNAIEFLSLFDVI